MCQKIRNILKNSKNIILKLLKIYLEFKIFLLKYLLINLFLAIDILLKINPEDSLALSATAVLGWSKAFSHFPLSLFKEKIVFNFDEKN